MRLELENCTQWRLSNKSLLRFCGRKFCRNYLFLKAELNENGALSGFVLLPYYLQTKHLRGLKTVNSNGFRLNFFALFKICWVYVECLGMFQTSRFSCAERIKTIDNQLKCLRIIYCF